jgi:hypothetical protein
MRSGNRSKRLGRRGAVQVEAALLLPLFLMLWFGIADWGLAFYVHQTIVHKANNAARWAVVHDFDTAKIAKVLLSDDPNAPDRESVWFSISKPDVDVQLLGTEVNNDRRVQITVSNYQWFHFTPFLSGRYFGRPVTVSKPVESLQTGL